jgi:Ca2+-binding EF-hand superfamily protein
MANRPPKGQGGFPRLGDLDKNRDGSVSFDEFLVSEFVQRLPEERRQAFFDRLDQNGDGKLSPEDRAMGERGRVEGRRPGENRPDLRGKFDALDTNGDQVLDFEEFVEAAGIKERGEDFQEDRFEELDKNGDLKLQRNEFKEGFKPPGVPRRGGPDGRGPDQGDRKAPPSSP